MSDEFTSVQWDRNDLSPQSFRTTQSPIVEAEHEEESHDTTPAATDKSLTKASENSSEEIPRYYINSTVSEPLKESDGSNHYISYLIKTSSDNPVFQSSEFQIRRRFSDFNFLFQCLLNDFPTVIVPPLPNKLRLEYIKGDRFSESFTSKRAVSLNNFLARVSKHEKLNNSKIYHIFLENSDYWNTYKQNLKLSSTAPAAASDTNETISDYIMNAFKKPTTNTENSKEFQEIITKANKLQENLLKIDKVYSKVIKKQTELSSNFMKFGDEFVKLNRLLNDTVEESTSDLDLSLVKNFKALSNDLHKCSSASDILTSQIDQNYLTSLKDLDHYIVQLKAAIKLKDSKLIDYEALINYLNKANNEKQAILHNGSGSTAEATIRFLNRKLESLTGTDGSYGSSNSADNRILKINSKITKLELEAQKALEVFENFEKLLLKEYYTKFEPIKTEEIDENLTKLAKFNLSFYNTVLQNWENLDETLVSSNDIDIAKSNLKLNEDSEHFKHDDITKNKTFIKEEYDKLVKIHEDRLKLRQEEGEDTELLEPPETTPYLEPVTSTNTAVEENQNESSNIIGNDEEEDDDDLLTASMLG